MSRIEKLYERLDALESEFKSRLVAELRDIAAGRGGLFFMREDHPQYTQLKGYVNPESGKLEGIGDEIISLRKKLKEPIGESLVMRLRAYRDKWGDLSDDNRRGETNLAKQFLAEIESDTS